MKMTLKTLAAAAAFVAAGVANAGTITLPTGGSVSDSNFDFSGLSGSGTLTFSSTLIGALNAGGVQVAQVDPAVVTTTTTTPTSSKYKTVSAAAPVTSLNASFNGTSLAVNHWYDVTVRNNIQRVLISPNCTISFLLLHY